MKNILFSRICQQLLLELILSSNKIVTKPKKNDVASLHEEAYNQYNEKNQPEYIHRIRQEYFLVRQIRL